MRVCVHSVMRRGFPCDNGGAWKMTVGALLCLRQRGQSSRPDRNFSRRRYQVDAEVEVIVVGSEQYKSTLAATLCSLNTYKSLDSDVCTYILRSSE